MRTGAILTGSCRALKWMALFGVVLALGAGSAAAQVTVSAASMGKVTEGSSLTLTVSAKLARVAGTLPASTITVTAAQATDATTPVATSAQTAEPADVSFNPASTRITFPARNVNDPRLM